MVIRKVKERDIQKTIFDYLRMKKILCFKHRNVGIFKKDTGSYIPLPFGEKGISDIIGCLPSGQFLAIEVKVKGNKPSPEQEAFILKVKAAGGKAFVAYSLEDVIRELG